MVLLVDHKSLIIVPAQDTARPPQSERKVVEQAREAELAVLQAIKLQDVLNEVYYDTNPHNTKIGFNFGYNVMSTRCCSRTSCGGLTAFMC